MITIVNTSDSPADRKFGFVFGVDGVVSLDDASAMMAGVHRSTIDRLVLAGHIRKGKVGNRVVYCRRSISEYLRSREV